MSAMTKLLATAILLTSASIAQATAAFRWTGTCAAGCNGTATGTLLLNDSYTPGTLLAFGDLISWSYTSSQFSLFIDPVSATVFEGVLPSSPGPGLFLIASGATSFTLDLAVGWISVGPGRFFPLADLGGHGEWTQVPEPATLLLIGVGLFGMVVARRRWLA